MAKFEPESYSKFRILYPEKLFEGLKSFCRSSPDQPLRVLDLGSGTGLSAASFASFFSGPPVEFVLIEPDSAMLAASMKTLEAGEILVERLCGSAEDFTLSRPVDLVLVGSAWHWMQAEQTIQSLLKALRPGGALFIFEYQFPKAKTEDGLKLNEWVRRSFNLKWKPDLQKPRGSLFEITEKIRSHSEFSQISQAEVIQEQALGVEQFLGAIISQSRFLDYEKKLSSVLALEERGRLRAELEKFWGSDQKLSFQYSFQGLVFRRRSI